MLCGWCSKCCTCHAKRAEPETRRCPKSSIVAGLSRTSLKVLQVLRIHAKRSGASPSAAPATQKEPENSPSAAPATQNEAQVLQVMCLPRKQGGAESNHLSPSMKVSKCCTCTQNEPEVLQVLRLPRKARRRPKASLVARLPPTPQDAPSAAPATPTSMKVLQVLHLPRKTNLRCSKCCACQAKRAGDAPSVAPATQNEPEVRRPK